MLFSAQQLENVPSCKGYSGVEELVKNTMLLGRTLNHTKFAAPNEDVQNVLNINALTRSMCYCDDRAVNLIYNVFSILRSVCFYF